jgi:hypothetical protein
MLTIINLETQDFFRPSRKEAIEMELKLNGTPYARDWKIIGDILYEFSMTGETHTLYVTIEQYERLLGFFEDNIKK